MRMAFGEEAQQIPCPKPFSHPLRGSKSQHLWISSPLMTQHVREGIYVGIQCQQIGETKGPHKLCPLVRRLHWHFSAPNVLLPLANKHSSDYRRPNPPILFPPTRRRKRNGDRRALKIIIIMLYTVSRCCYAPFVCTGIQLVYG